MITQKYGTPAPPGFRWRWTIHRTRQDQMRRPCLSSTSRRPSLSASPSRIPCWLVLTDEVIDRGLGCRFLARLYGPAARCKPKSDDLEKLVLRFCIRPIDGAFGSWPSWISARARSHSRLGPEGHTGHLITNALAKPFSISSFQLADLGGKANSTIVLGASLSVIIPLVSVSGCRLREARLITAFLRQHRPGDPCQLVGGAAAKTLGWRR